MRLDRLDVHARFSEIVVHGRTVYLSGQVPERTSDGDISIQTADVLALIDAHLARAGTDRAHLLSATIYLVDLKRDYVNMNAVWDRWLPPGCAPARTTVGVVALANPAYLVEITCTAALPEATA